MSDSRTLYERFLSHFVIEIDSKCWLWTSGLTAEGYGKMKVEGKTVLAHRLSYTLNVGSIPEGMTLDHLCRVRRCINPEHLEPVSQRENTMRGIGPSAKNAVATHCKRGHEFTEENTRIAGGKRHCRKCYTIRTMEHYYRKKANNA